MRNRSKRLVRPSALYNRGMHKVTRRSFVGMGAAALLPLPAMALPAAMPYREIGFRRYRFFDAAEAQFIEAACERLIPADASGPGALDAGVPHYVDWHLGSSWGAGKRLYRCGEWQPGSPLSLPSTPAEFFRKAIGAINREFAKGGILFSKMPHAAQDRFLTALEAGETLLDGAPAARFFDLLLTLTVEGFFSSPLQGSRDRVVWRVTGFPGAHAGVLRHT
jgi:gluconate 2-dehydrogenase gamma chain